MPDHRANLNKERWLARMSALVELEGVEKRLSPAFKLRVSKLEVEDGEIFGLIGPSGSGKTTLLKVLAGVEFPDRGTIRFKGRPLVRRKESGQEIIMVWQSLALFPHMSVGENIGFGLKVRGYGGTMAENHVGELLSMLDLEGYERRTIASLSGGEKQRVALGRALAVEPRVILLDEPFGSVDDLLRSRLQMLLVEIQRKTGVTIMIVTHDQPEALMLCGRLAVMRDGAIVEAGTPRALVDCPQTGFVAEFVGGMNVIAGVLKYIRGDELEVTVGGTRLVGRRASWVQQQVVEGSTVFLVFRTSAVRLGDTLGSSSSNSLKGVVDGIGIHQNKRCVVVKTPEAEEVRVELLGMGEGWGGFRYGKRVVVSWPYDDCYVLPRYE